MAHYRGPNEVPSSLGSNDDTEVPRGLTVLFDLYFDPIYRFCLVRSDSATVAEDAAAETFADAARLFATDRSCEVTEGWLFTVARRRVIDQWRSAERERRRFERVVKLWPAEAVEESDYQVDLVRRALASLPKRQRAVLMLRYLDELSVDEVAATLDTSHRAAESLLARGRRGFIRAYRRESK